MGEAFEYTYTDRDRPGQRATRYILWSRRTRFIATAMAILLYLGSLAAVLTFARTNYDVVIFKPQEFALGNWLMGALAVIVGNKINCHFIDKRISQSAERTGPFHVRLAPEGLFFTDRGGKAELRWQKVASVKAYPSGLAILFNGTVIYPVPEASLPSDLSIDEAKARIESWRRAAEGEANA